MIMNLEIKYICGYTMEDERIGQPLRNVQNSATDPVKNYNTFGCFASCF